MNDEVENFVSKAKNSPNEVVLWDKLSSRIVFEDFRRYKSYIFLKFFFSQVDTRYPKDRIWGISSYEFCMWLNCSM